MHQPTPACFMATRMWTGTEPSQAFISADDVKPLREQISVFLRVQKCLSSGQSELFPRKGPGFGHWVIMAPFVFVESAAIIRIGQHFIYETNRSLWMSMKMGDYIQILALKGIFYTKMKMLTSFTHPHVNSNMYVLFFCGTQKMSWKMFTMFFSIQ